MGQICQSLKIKAQEPFSGFLFVPVKVIVHFYDPVG